MSARSRLPAWSGLGGAAFPTHVKLKVPEGKKIDTVIVNGCECEPYLTSDHRVMVEYPKEVLYGARVAMRAVGAARAIVGVEDNKMDAVAALKKANGAAQDIKIEAVAAKYPQGAEKMLVMVLLSREIPSGGLPADIGVGVFNVATLAQIGELLPHRQGLIERVMTVSGPGVTKPGNYLVALGTPIRWILEQAGCTDQATSVILGGPMMGASIGSFDVPVTKGVTGILVLTNRESERAHFPLHPLRLLRHHLSHAPESVSARNAGPQGALRGNGRRISSQRLLRMRML